jgi:glycosyltransferase involved in cell wall biosynthesis
LKVLIVAEHASARFGGEAALPFHYFRVLRQRGIDVWMICHERTRRELLEYFGDDARIVFVADSNLHKFMFRLGKHLPDRVAYMTTGFIARISCQLTQRKLAKQIILRESITVVHQPIPVSPREPSMMYKLGAPVVIGPMNGAMSFPPGFGEFESRFEKITVSFGRRFTRVINFVLRGKRQANTLLVANQRTADALDFKHYGRVENLIENGVDLALWRTASVAQSHVEGNLSGKRTICFVFVGRMVGWKAVDLLINALKLTLSSSQDLSINLTLVGDGVERSNLQAQCERNNIAMVDNQHTSGVFFAGWKTQPECAQVMAKSDALVLSSLYECGGAVVLEAMAASKPVITVAWGGPLDYCTNANAILIHPESKSQIAKAFSEAMLQLARDPALRRRLGEAGRDRVLQDFDWEKKGNRIIEVYARAASDVR